MKQPMTPEAQRITIAEACGWTREGYLWRGPTHRKDWPASCRAADLPDYLNDLNAMHEAEKVLTNEQEKEYAYQLEAVCCPREYGWHATAAQRAEAFLRTLNLWKP
jgi:hypothetical protein